jgi:hypothetical protein
MALRVLLIVLFQRSDETDVSHLTLNVYRCQLHKIPWKFLNWPYFKKIPAGQAIEVQCYIERLRVTTVAAEKQ